MAHVECTQYVTIIMRTLVVCAKMRNIIMMGTITCSACMQMLIEVFIVRNP